METLTFEQLTFFRLECVRNNEIQVRHTRTARGLTHFNWLCLVADDVDSIEREHVAMGNGSIGGHERLAIALTDFEFREWNTTKRVHLYTLAFSSATISHCEKFSLIA